MIFRQACWLLVLTLVAACGARGPELRVAAVGEPGICRVAVLPFTNQSDLEGAGALVTRVVMSELVAAGLEVAEEGMVRRFLERERCRPGKCVPARLVQKMGEELGVSAVVGGVVTEARRVGEEVQLGFLLWVKDARTGRFLWGTYYTRSGEDYRTILHFGKISSLSALADRMVEEIVQAAFKRRLFRCSVS